MPNHVPGRLSRYPSGTFDLGDVVAGSEIYANTKAHVRRVEPLHTDKIAIVSCGSAFEHYMPGDIGIQDYGNVKETVTKLGEQMGQASKHQGMLLFTGGACGFVGTTARAAYTVNPHIQSIGFSPHISYENHQKYTHPMSCVVPESDLVHTIDSSEADTYHTLISPHTHRPFDFREKLNLDKFSVRERMMIALSHGITAVGGGSGTEEEIFYALDFGRPVGLVLGTGGIVDRNADHFIKEGRRRGVKVVAHYNPITLMEELLVAAEECRNQEDKGKVTWPKFVSNYLESALASQSRILPANNQNQHHRNGYRL